jgi:hypothetical protein
MSSDLARRLVVAFPSSGSDDRVGGGGIPAARGEDFERGPAPRRWCGVRGGWRSTAGHRRSAPLLVSRPGEPLGPEPPESASATVEAATWPRRLIMRMLRTNRTAVGSGVRGGRS